MYGLAFFFCRSCPSLAGTLGPTGPVPVLCCTQSRHRNPSGKTSHRLPARYYGPRPTFPLLREATCELKYSSSAFRQFCSFSAFFSFRSPIPSTPSARQAITTFTDETRSPLPTRNNPPHHHHHDLIDTSLFFLKRDDDLQAVFFFSSVLHTRVSCTAPYLHAKLLVCATPNHTNPWCRALPVAFSTFYFWARISNPASEQAPRTSNLPYLPIYVPRHVPASAQACATAQTKACFSCCDAPPEPCSSFHSIRLRLRRVAVRHRSRRALPWTRNHNCTIWQRPLLRLATSAMAWS